jgi:hypothetical protein
MEVIIYKLYQMTIFVTHSKQQTHHVSLTCKPYSQTQHLTLDILHFTPPKKHISTGESESDVILVITLRLF